MKGGRRREEEERRRKKEEEVEEEEGEGERGREKIAVEPQELLNDLELTIDSILIFMEIASQVIHQSLRG